MKKIYEIEGLKGFWRGGLMGMAKSTLNGGIFFYGIEYFHIITQSLRQSLPENSVDFLTASLAKVTSTLISNPLNVIKTRFEVVGNFENKAGMLSIYEKHGFKGYYKGLLSALLRDAPWAGI